MEGDFIHINRWLLPLSWLYGVGVRLRNSLYDSGILHERSFEIPVINVGNITVGGTGKTPHVEYLIRLLATDHKVAVLSRGYKRHTKGYRLADSESRMEDIGDEPWQMQQKYGERIHIAVDADRCHGIRRLTTDAVTRDTEVVLLDDAFQHRAVKPGLNILLVDYHRIITRDRLLPAGRLREHVEGKERAHIVIVTKCPRDLKPMDFRIVEKELSLRPYQQLYFSTLRYGTATQLFGQEQVTLEEIRDRKLHVLLLTGIASPQQLLQDISPYDANVRPMVFPDHHYFTAADAQTINSALEALPHPRIVLTTEKDAARLKKLSGLSPATKASTYVLPVEAEIMKNATKKFNEKIIHYVHTHH